MKKIVDPYPFSDVQGARALRAVEFMGRQREEVDIVHP